MADTRRTIKRIHVDQHLIRKDIGAPIAERQPVLTVQNRGRSTKAKSVRIEGPSEVVYGEKPLSCGARVWIETREIVVAYGERIV